MDGFEHQVEQKTLRRVWGSGLTQVNTRQPPSAGPQGSMEPVENQEAGPAALRFLQLTWDCGSAREVGGGGEDVTLLKEAPARLVECGVCMCMCLTGFQGYSQILL